MGKLTPLFPAEKTAAELMDMKLSEFRDLVQKGVLPKGHVISDGVVRWYRPDLEAIASGKRAYEGPEW